MTDPETTDPETLAILSDPEAMRQIAESEAAIAQGLVETEGQLAEAMQRRLRKQTGGAPVGTNDSRSDADHPSSFAARRSSDQTASDVNATEFAEAAHHQSRAIAASSDAEADQAFLDSVSEWPKG